MEIRGRETQIWGNQVNEMVLLRAQRQEDNFVSVNDPDMAFSIPVLFSDELTESISVYGASAGTTIEISLPEWMEDYIEFRNLMDEWQKNRASWRSFSGDLMRDPSYARIIGHGQAFLKFILWELYMEVNTGSPILDWFYALWAITGQNPVPATAQGNVRKAAEAWIEWGKREGLIVDASLGTTLSESGSLAQNERARSRL
jgi:hypothetical protein